jgi:hypothetical protein
MSLTEVGVRLVLLPDGEAGQLTVLRTDAGTIVVWSSSNIRLTPQE